MGSSILSAAPVPSNPSSRPLCWSTQSRARATSMPSGLCQAPPTSEMASTFAPRGASSRAALEPALPKPWMATVRPFIFRRRWAIASSRQ